MDTDHDDAHRRSGEGRGAVGSRWVMVTGAGSGIGLAITQALSARGEQVLATARRLDDLALLGALPGVTPFELDVRDPARIAAAKVWLQDQGGRLDGLVHNAGIGELGHLAAWSDEDLVRLFDVNVFGPQRLTRDMMPLLMAAQGRVVCIGSMGGSITQPLYGPYTMSKHALEAFAACLLQELKPFGLAVSIVQPGAVATRIGDSSSRPNQARLLATPAPFDVGARQVLQAGSSAPTPRDAEPESASNRRPAAPEAVAAVVLQALFDAAPQARYLVGTPWEGRRVVDALIERLLDAAQSPGQQLDRTSLIALIDAAAARRAQRPW